MRDPRITGYTPKPVPGLTPEEIIEVHSSSVGCDGGKGPFGHPLIYMRLENGRATCPYCSRTYVLAADAHDEHDH
jgi:uncharacterized Zn-finger protein